MPRIRMLLWFSVLSFSLGTGGCPGDDDDSDGDDDTADSVCGDGEVEGDEECDDANDVAWDGCEDDCTETAAEVVCAELPPLPSGTCEVTAGDAWQLITGDVLIPHTILRGGEVLVDGAGMITCVGCDCAAEAPGATRVLCPTGVVSPGLINGHDHLGSANNSPLLDTGERFEHRHDWRKGLGDHTDLEYLWDATPAQMQWGELRFLLGGATSTNGAEGGIGILRNLDTQMQEGLDQPSVYYGTFPLDDSSGEVLTSGCGYPSILSSDWAASIYDAWTIHVAEGIDDRAHNEFACLSSTADGGEDHLLPQCAFVHGIATTADDLQRMAGAGTALIWSPRSALALYGDTATVGVAHRLGVTIALGSDWVVTGSMNLQRELQCADSFARDYLGDPFEDRELWRMVTWYPARVLAVDDAVGILAPGLVADIAVFNGAAHADHRAVIDAAPEDTVLVWRGGVARYGDEAPILALRDDSCDALEVCGTDKRVCLVDDIPRTLPELAATVAPAYPLYFCGQPDDEPTCIPSRPESVDGSTVYTGIPTGSDADGDGIEDGADNCPDVFNPIRPMDGGAQPDHDQDGEGDRCDPCPLDAGVSDCP